MNEGFKKYYRIGQKSTYFACRNFKNLLNYYAFLIMEVIACITIIPIPILILAKVKMAKKIKYEQSIDTINLFSVHNKKGFKQLWLSILLLLLHYLSRVILIVLAGGFCFLIGLTISYYINQAGSSATKELLSTIIITILTLPATIVHLVYTVYFVLSIAPLSFVIASSENMTVTQAIQCSFQAMKQAKGTLFLISLVYSLISLVTIGVVSGGIIVCIMFVKSSYVQIIICILISLIGFYIVSRFLMSSMVARYSLFEDLVRNTATEKIVNHIKFSRYKGNYQSAEKNKLQMFDDLSSFDGRQNQLQETPPSALEVSNQEEPAPIEVPHQEEAVAADVPQEEPAPIEVPHQEEAVAADVPQEEPAPVEVPHQEEAVVVDVPQEEPAPVEVPHQEEAVVVDVPQEEPAPIEVPHQEEALVIDVPQEEPAPVEVPHQEEAVVVDVPQEEPTPVEVPHQEEAVKPKRGRKPKALKIEEEAVTPKKTVRKTSTKKSKADDENSSDASTDDTKGDN